MKIKSFFWFGEKYASDLLDEKSIFLLNAACIIWHGANLFLIVLGFTIMPEVLDASSLLLIGVHTFLMISVQILQNYGCIKIARALFLFGAFAVFFVYDLFVLPGYYISFYYIIPVLLSQLLFNKKIIHYFLLVVSVCLFFNFFNLFNPAPFDLSRLHFVNYFIALFFIVDMLIKVNFEKQEILLKQKIHLEELNRFQSSFFVNLSHELKTPLTIIRGAVSALDKGKELEPQKLLIERQSMAINNLIDDMITLNKLQMKKLKLNKEEIDLSLLIKKIHASFSIEFENRGLSFDLILNQIFRGVFDSVYLERAINNILINALKYTSSGGVCISIQEMPQNKTVAIKIKDTGIGIDKSELKQVLERYYQGNNSINKSSGTGIGLSFTQELISLHGGDLTIESVEGKGTTVTITLPITSVQEKPLNESNIPLTNHLTSKEGISSFKLLVVEDNLEMQNYLKEILVCYNLEFCTNGIEALDLVQKNSFDLLITDYMMPLMDGKELIIELNKKKLELPIIMLTARSDIQDKLELLRMGIDDYITKPFNEKELLARIDILLRNFKSRNEFISENNIDVSSENDSPFIHKLRLFIEENCGSLDFGVNLICEEFGLSNSSLYRKVKSHTGLNTQELIKEVKLKKAHNLILDKEVETVKEVSHIVGFGKPSYFAEVYANTYGCKPFNESGA